MASSMRTLLGVFVLVLAINKLLWAVGGTELTVQQVEVNSPMHLPGVYNIRLLRATKFNRTATVINFDVDVESVIDDSFSFQADIYYSRLGDSNFAKSPFHRSKDSLCKTFERIRSKNVVKEILAASNVPKDLPCPFPKGNYWMKNFLASRESLDVPYLPDGLWRVELFFYDNTDKLIVTIHILVRAETKSLFG